MIFAFIPPPGIAGGWLCFFVSLILIGVLVIIVGDLAGIFGCLGKELPRRTLSLFW
jgi:solute carrier family 8 (sodium/calcium exchanger)